MIQFVRANSLTKKTFEEKMSNICFFSDNMAYRYVGLIFAALSVLQKNRRPFFGGEERGLTSRTVVIEPNRYVDFLQV